MLGLSSRGENRTHGNSFIRTAPSPLGYSRIVGRYECHLIPTFWLTRFPDLKGDLGIGKPRNRTVDQPLERDRVTITPHAGVKLQNGGHQYLVSEGKWWIRTTKHTLNKVGKEQMDLDKDILIKFYVYRYFPYLWLFFFRYSRTLSTFRGDFKYYISYMHHLDARKEATY